MTLSMSMSCCDALGGVFVLTCGVLICCVVLQKEKKDKSAKKEKVSLLSSIVNSLLCCSAGLLCSCQCWCMPLS